MTKERKEITGDKITHLAHTIQVRLRDSIQAIQSVNDDIHVLHDSIVGLDAAILMHPRVWEASGHVANFSDPLVDCKDCKSRFRADDDTQISHPLKKENFKLKFKY